MAAHKAYRIKVSANNGDALLVVIAELKLFNGVNNFSSSISNIGNTYYGSASSSGYNYISAFDDSSAHTVSTIWATTPPSPTVNVGVVLPSTEELTSYEYIASQHSDAATQTAKDWVIEYSDDTITSQLEWDAATWVVVDTRASETGWSIGESRVYIADPLMYFEPTTTQGTLTLKNIHANNSTGLNGTAISNFSKNSDKRYFEIEAGVTNADQFGLGVLSSNTLGGGGGASANDYLFLLRGLGGISLDLYSGGAVVATAVGVPHTPVTGDVFGVSLDFATGELNLYNEAGAFSLGYTTAALINASMYAYVWYKPNQDVLANFGHKPFTHNIPVGYIAWDGVPPPLLVLVGDSETVNQNSVNNNFSVLANDTGISGGETLTVSTPPSNGTAIVNIDGVTIDYTPTPLYFGADSFQYDIDASGSPATVTINIIASHKSWRLVVNNNNGGVKVTLADIELLSGLVNQGLNSGVSYESSFDNASNKGDKAFDGTATPWISAAIDFALVDTVITWHSVDRNLQTKPFIGWNEGSGNVPENNTIIHHINIYDENDVLIKTDTIPYTANVSQYSYTYTQAQEKTDSGLTRINTSLRIEIWVSRTDNFDLDGSGVAPHVIESWQRFDHRFNRV